MIAKNSLIYMTTMLAGLEEIIIDEVKAIVADAIIIETQRGKVFFSSSLPLETILTLRSIDNLFIFISKFSMGSHKVHLSEIEQKMKVIDLSRVIDFNDIQNQNVSFVVNSSRSGKQTYSRFDMSEVASRGLLKQFPNWKIGTAENHQLEFRLDLTNEQALFSFRITPTTFRFRGNQRMFSKASLRPSVAHALVWLSRPQKDEFFLDPFCGSGTIVAERASYDFGQIYAGDISFDVVEIAKQNLPILDNLFIRQWDARELPLDACSIDTMVSNLPFGEQILNPDEIFDLYLKLFKQLKRIMKANSHAIVLTDKVVELQKVTDKFNLECYVHAELSLKGLHPEIFKITF